MTSKNSIFPWDAIPAGKDLIPVSDEVTGPHRFLWALDAARRPTLLYTLIKGEQHVANVQLPELQGLEMFYQENEKTYLVVTLSDRYFIDIFYEFCQLLINATASTKTTRDALILIVNRCWRWHNFLNTRRSEMLSPSRQQGLYAELYFLKNYLFPRLGIVNSLACWRGPYESPQDFILDHTSIEIKSSSPSSRSHIRISSEFQLEESGSQNLILIHFLIASNQEAGMSLTALIEDILRIIEIGAPNIQDLFQTLITEAGFSWQHDYSKYLWNVDGLTNYIVRGDFPRLTPATISSSLSSIRYSIDTAALSSYVLSSEDLLSFIGQDDHYAARF